MNRNRQLNAQDEAEQQEMDAEFLGVNLRLAPEKLLAAFLADASNVRMTDRTAAPRKGVTKPGWLNVTDAASGVQIQGVQAFHGGGVFKDPDSFEWVLLAADGGIVRCKEHNARYSMPLPTGVKVLDNCTFVQAFNKVFCFRGRHLAPLLLNDLDTGWEDLVQRWDAATAYDAAIAATGQAAEEIAYGPFQAVSSLTSVGDLATVVTSSEHGYITGADVVIQGAAQTEYNGRFNITVIDPTTFTYQFTGSATTPATGTITVSNMSYYWKALGTVRDVSGITRSSQTATATSTAHGFSNGQYVTIAGAGETEYNGTFVISNVTANTFDYTVTGSPTSPATGSSITAQTSVVLAGQSPDTNPEAWTRRYDILPNADDALFINNRLLVPTAYTPGADGYDSTSSWTKKDFIVATDALDEIHFDFINEFRINQGDDSEIVQLLKYDNDTVIVFKDKIWGVLANIRVDLSQVTLDMRPTGYGLCTRGAAVVAGKDVYFMATNRGIVSLNQTVQGLLQSVDVPFSNDIEPWIRRINWNFKDKIRLAWWDNKLYCAVPMDDATVDLSVNLVAADAVYGNGYLLSKDYNLSVPVGPTYNLTLGNARLLSSGRDGAPVIPGTVTYRVTADGEFTPPTGSLWLTAVSGTTTGTAVTAKVETIASVTQVNNAMLVYDFRNQAWAGRDTGQAITPKEFILATSLGRERLFYLAEDGYVNLVEESEAGDQVYDPTTDSGLGWAEIETTITTRGYRLSDLAHKRFPFMELTLSVWNASYSVSAGTGTARPTRNLITARTYSRSTYLRPWNATPYDTSNANDDAATAGRGDYSVALASGGLYCGSGLPLNTEAEVFERLSTQFLNGQFVQFTVTNNQGRCAVKSITAAGQAGQRRMGII